MMDGQCLKTRDVEPKIGIEIQGKTLCFQDHKYNTKSLKLLFKKSGVDCHCVATEVSGSRQETHTT